MSITAGGRTRTYDLVAPKSRLVARLPVVVVLHGINASVSNEEQRTGLIPAVDNGQLMLVYPAGYQRSWNAGNCCGAANRDDIDDVAFLTAVFDQVAARPDVDPTRMVLLGYSNGGRMAYDVACQQPRMMAALIVVGAVPDTVCTSHDPLPLLQIASSDDPEVAYAPGDTRHYSGSFAEPSVVDQVDTWRTRNGCESAFTRRIDGHLEVQTWFSCSSGERVELVTYGGGIKHLWPYGDKTTPSGATVIIGFLADAGLVASPS